MGAVRELRPDRGGAEVSAASLQRTVEALLFLSSDPLTIADMAAACEVDEASLEGAVQALERELEEAGRGIVVRRVAGGWTLASDPEAEPAARRLFSQPRTPPLTQAQAETLAIIAYLQPVSRPEIARIRGVSSDSGVQSLTERGLIEESGRSQFGAIIYKTTPLFEKLFGLEGLDALPDPARFDPTPEDEAELRERLLRAGEQRAEA